MASIINFITYLLIISPVFSYVIIKDNNNNNEPQTNNFEISEEYTQSPPKQVVHRQKIPQRGQIIDDILPEITTFLELAKSINDPKLNNDGKKSVIDSTEDNINQMNSKSDEIIERKPLNFGDILTVLALWNLANAFNDYNVSDELSFVTESNSMKSQSNPWPEIKTRQNDNNYLF